MDALGEALSLDTLSGCLDTGHYPMSGHAPMIDTGYRSSVVTSTCLTSANSSSTATSSGHNLLPLYSSNTIGIQQRNINDNTPGSNNILNTSTSQCTPPVLGPVLEICPIQNYDTNTNDHRIRESTNEKKTHPSTKPDSDRDTIDSSVVYLWTYLARSTK
ncbi:hypothetical protein LSH36_34g05033 [Paralvinella palmiformis]|uniref:Uncharacterized protein n=1 Tax=Paralvinella palmiformis TaxID=53620 RepID=A0AAD9NH18_9ANNE|nr:hypothetical protein LSH36_34g05033 [Paralvinella palmiformis]